MLIRLFCICCLLLITFAQTAAGSAPPLILDEAVTVVNPARLLATFKAPKNDLSLKQISSPVYSAQFKPNIVEATNYGHHARDFWLRFDVTATSKTEWYLLIDRTVMGNAALFIVPHHSATPSHTPPVSPLFQAVQQQRSPSWRLQLPPNHLFSIYLRVNAPKEALVLPVKLMQEDAFITHTQQRYLFFAIVWGGIIVLALYNLFLAFFLQDKSYFAFVVCLCFAIFLSYRAANLFPAHFDLLINPNNPYYSSIGLLAYASCHYYMSLLHHNTYNWLEMYSRVMMWLAVAGAVLAFFFYQSADLFLFFFIPSALMLPALMIRAIALGHHSVRNSFVSILLLIVSIGIYMPLTSDTFPDYPVEMFDLGQAGILLSFLVFSLNHAARTRDVIAQAEHTEANSKATHNFLTTMNHELRTPMHVVMGANELLKTTPLNQAQKSYLSSMELASQQMLELIDEVLETARLHNAETISLNKQPFDLFRLLENINTMFSVKAQEKALDFIVNIQDGLSPAVTGDAQRLNQILTNLLGNAIKHTDTGTIKLSAVGQSIDGANLIRFSVEDTGSGIATEQQTLIFQPFFQADSSRSRINGGAGLGLSISHKLVQQMGGELKLYSTLGKGSCFFFSLDLPMHQYDKKITTEDISTSILPTHGIENTSPNPIFNTPLPNQNQVSQVSLSGLRVLMVDDGKLNLIIGKQLLEIQGANVTTASSGFEALEYLKQGQLFDFVLMDISMPEMDGYQTTQYIREDLQLYKLPIIALTAHAIEGEKERCLAARMDDYLSKPFQTEQLLKLVRQHEISPVSIH